MSISANQFGALLFGDLVSVPVLSVTEDKYADALRGFVDAENAAMQRSIDQLCDVGTDSQSGFGSGIGGRLQRASEFGGPEATRSGDKWYVGYPIESFADRQMYTVPYLEGVKFGDLAAQILNVTLKDISTVQVELLRSFLLSTNYTFDDSNWPGAGTTSYSVRRLANADSAAGSVYANHTEIALAALNHYLVSGGANPTTAAFRQARNALRNVGCDKDIVYIVSRTTAQYVADNLSADLVLPVDIRNARFADPVGKYALVDMPEAVGRIADGQLVSWPMFPDNYIFAYDRSKEKPVRMRQHANAKYQGFNLTNDNDPPNINTHPLVNKYWRRFVGFGVRNRVNGVVVQITTDGAYSDPSLV